MRSISGKLLFRALPVGSFISSQVGAVVSSAARGGSRSFPRGWWHPAGRCQLASPGSAPAARLLPARSPRSPSPSLMTGNGACLQTGCLQLGELVWVAAWWVLELPCSSNVPAVIFSSFNLSEFSLSLPALFLNGEKSPLCLTFQGSEDWLFVFSKPPCRGSPSLCCLSSLEQTLAHLAARLDYSLESPAGAVAPWLLTEPKWWIWSCIITGKWEVQGDVLPLKPGSLLSCVPGWRSSWRRWWLAPSVSWKWYLAGCLDTSSVQSWFLSQLLQFFHTSPLILKQIYM